MKLKNLHLGLSSVARTTSSRSLQVIGTSVIKKRNEANTAYTDETDGYAIECCAYKGDTLKIKFPISVSDKISELNALLEKDMTVDISFTGLKLTPYAMKVADGSVLSGVSAKADSFEIVQTVSNDIDELMIDL